MARGALQDGSQAGVCLEGEGVREGGEEQHDPRAPDLCLWLQHRLLSQMRGGREMHMQC